MSYLNMSRQRSILKWAGSKYRILSQLLPHFPQATRLIEPFTGSGALFLNSSYSQYLLGESNLDLISLYKILQQEGAYFIAYCKPLFTDTQNNAYTYYNYRNEFNHCDNLHRRAALFIYLNRHGFNGLCRYNKKRYYNVPFGRYKKPYFPEKEMLLFHQKSHAATFVHADFTETFQHATKHDLIYCDPPYI